MICMRAGRIVFYGSGVELTVDVVREIYGANDSFSESATSTSVEALYQPEFRDLEIA